METNPTKQRQQSYCDYANGQQSRSEFRLKDTSLILRKSVIPQRQIIKLVPGGLRADKDVVAGGTGWITVYTP